MTSNIKPYSYHGTDHAARGGDTIGQLSPVDIARERAARLYPTAARSQEQFMDAFALIRSAELRGRDTWWVYRDALNAGNTVAVAAYIEGVASARGFGGAL